MAGEQIEQLVKDSKEEPVSFGRFFGGLVDKATDYYIAKNPPEATPPANTTTNVRDTAQAEIRQNMTDRARELLTPTNIAIGLGGLLATGLLIYVVVRAAR